MQIKYTSSQEKALKILQRGDNVFLTGSAGTGKSFLLKEYLKELEEQEKNVLITAPTGIAAININGVTLHRAFNITPADIYTLEATHINSDILNASVDAIVIDEISMCRCDLFDVIGSKILEVNKKRIKNNLNPIQVITVGDFYQLPPVITRQQSELLNIYYNTNIKYGFAFETQSWKKLKFHTISLEETVRQSDNDYIFNLNQLRIGNRNTLNFFKNNSSKSVIKNGIWLTCKNKEAEDINVQELSKINEKEYNYFLTSTGTVSESDKVLPDVLKVKKGARVMSIINIANDNICNGSLGTVVECNENEIIVLFDVNKESNIKTTIQRNTWEISKYKINKSINGSSSSSKIEIETIGKYTQFPLKLAYAITIHKSQGQTYDSMNLDARACWAAGQLYVALSRTKKLDQLYIKGYLSQRNLVTSEIVGKLLNNEKYDLLKHTK